MSAGRFELRVQRLRFSWLDATAKSILGGFAAALGDEGELWGKQANIEHLPQYAADPLSVPLTANERQIDASPTETVAALATRLTYASTVWRLGGTPLGLLLALYEAGFDQALFVQQNGAYLQINATPNLADLAALFVAPPTVPAWITQGTLGPCPAVAGLQPLAIGDSPWWTFDALSTDVALNQFNSRFAILFPGPLFPALLTTWQAGTATFDGTADTVPITWPAAFHGATYRVFIGPPTVTDGGGGVTIANDGTAQSTTGIQLLASAPFVGSVDAVAYEVAISTGDLARMQAIINRWRPAKATCVGIYVVRAGRCFDWSLTTFTALAAYTFAQLAGDVTTYAGT